MAANPLEPSGEWKAAEHMRGYLERADDFPHRAEGERVLLDYVPRDVRRILDLGTGNGRLISLLRGDRPQASCVASTSPR